MIILRFSLTAGGRGVALVSKGHLSGFMATHKNK